MFFVISDPPNKINAVKNFSVCEWVFIDSNFLNAMTKDVFSQMYTLFLKKISIFVIIQARTWMVIYHSRWITTWTIKGGTNK